MTDAAPASSLTLRDLFTLGRSLADAGSSAPSSGLDDLVSVELEDAAIDPEVLLDGILGQLGGLLDVEVASILATAWSKARQLQEYRDPTRHPPDERAAVSLASHTVRSRYHPSLELLVNGRSVDTLGIDVSVELELEALVLEIQNAHILAVRPGRCTARGQVTCKTVPMAQLDAREIELPGRREFDGGIEIPDLDGAPDEPAPAAR